MAVRIRIEGSISTVRPDADSTDDFWAWYSAKIVDDTMDRDEQGDHLPWQTWGDALVVETNYLATLVRGLQDDGFEVKA
jgi:hypothetical protein